MENLNNINPGKKEIINEFFNIVGDVVDPYAIVNNNLNPYILKNNPLGTENQLITVFIDENGLDVLRTNLQSQGFNIEKLNNSYLTTIINHYDDYTNKSVYKELSDIIESSMDLYY